MASEKTIAEFYSSAKNNEKGPSHKDWIRCVCVINEDLIASCGEEKIIKIWKINEQKCIAILEGHSDSINGISLMSDGNLVSCSDDNSVKIWDINEEKCLKTISDHEDYVWKASEISENRICSCSEDTNLILYSNSYPYKKIATLNGHLSGVITFVELNKLNLIVSASFSVSPLGKEIKFWNSKNFKCETTVANMYCKSLLKFDDSTVIAGAEKGVTVIDCITFQTKYKIESKSVNGDILCQVKLDDGAILCGTGGGGLVVIDVNKKEYTYINVKAHTQDVTCLAKLNDSVIVSCSFDKHIRVWGYIEKEQLEEQEIKKEIMKHLFLKFLSSLNNQEGN